MPFSMERVAATRSTDLRVRLVQTKIGRDKPVARPKKDQNCPREGHKAPERRAEFDPAEAMCQLNCIGHDFSRVQVGKGRFTYKCRLCFLRGERSFLKATPGQTQFCHFAQRCSSACSRLHSHT